MDTGDLAHMHTAQQLDREIADLLRVHPISSVDFASWTLESVPALRRAMAQQPPPARATAAMVDDVETSRDDGRPGPMVRVQVPPGAGAARPCIYWIHGGGYMFGSALAPDPTIDRWVTDHDCVVVGVDYRLAPEHPFPAALDDCYDGLRWVVRNADRLGIDTSRIVVVGASAGGGLAAALTLMVRDRRELAVSQQVLIYPMLDDRGQTPSSQMADAPVWNPTANRLSWQAYLGHEPGRADVAPYAVPARADAVGDLPPTFITVGAVDVLRDESIEFAQRLLAAGVHTELHVYPGAPHGFDRVVAGAAVSQRARRDLDEALARALRATVGNDDPEGEVRT